MKYLAGVATGIWLMHTVVSISIKTGTEIIPDPTWKLVSGIVASIIIAIIVNVEVE
jgi:uncharacterized membrane protein